MPLPNDEIKGIITQSKKIEIHRSNCGELHNAIYRKDNVKQIRAEWFVNNDDNPSFRSRIAITLKNTSGAIAKVTATLAREGVDIRNFNIIFSNNKQAKLSFIIIVRNSRELYLFMRLIRKLDISINVEIMLNRP